MLIEALSPFTPPSLRHARAAACRRSAAFSLMRASAVYAFRDKHVLYARQTGAKQHAEEAQRRSMASII